MRRIFLACVVAGSVAIGAFVGIAPASAQAVTTAQISTFWRLLSTATGGYFASNLGLLANGYVTFGSTVGSTGYGFRDVDGVMQFKNSGGSWATFAGGGPSSLATFWIATADETVPNGKVLGALGTGLVINATWTGAPSIYAGTTCTAMFPRSLDASGAATCAKVALGADVSGTIAAANFPALTGDITTPGASLETTLASTGVGAGAVGSATAIPVITFDAKGRATVKTTATPQLTLTGTYFSSLAATNLTGIPGANVTGTLATAAVPAFTGDMTNSAGSLATTVGKIGGQAIALGGSFTVAGAFATVINVTAGTTITLPTSGTLISNTVATLSSLSSIGTITTGVWHGTVVGATYGGTGINNGSSTLTLGGATSFVGAFTTAITVTGATAVTLPVTGTLISDTVTTLSSLANVGTILTGTWHGTTLGIAYGGTGVTVAGDDTVLIGSGAAWVAKSLPNCVVGALNYATATNTWSCNTSISSGETWYFNTTGTLVAIGAQSDGTTNMVPVVVASTTNNIFDMDNGGANTGRIRYTGSVTQNFQVSISASFQPATASENFVFALAKNGTIDVSGKTMQRTRLTSEFGEVIIVDLVSLAQNDYLELYVGNMSAAHNATFGSLQITLHAIE